MGEAAVNNADVVFVTDDNPRTEEAAAIRAEVMAGCPDATEIGDRAVAIAQAVSGLTGDDILLIAGKGHEAWQEVAGQRFPFSDAEQVRHALSLNGGVA